MKLSFTGKFLLSIVMGVVVVFVIDPLDKSTISTPFLLGIILMGLSLRQSLPLVISVSALYCVFTFYALITFHEYIATHVHVSPHPIFWFFQRSGLFLILCALAIYLTHYRTDTTRILSRFRTILSKLPSPVVISDAAGHIAYANDAAAAVLNRSIHALTGSNYFDFIQTGTMKGQSIRAYFEMFESDMDDAKEVEIAPFGRNDRRPAQIICLGTGLDRIMITVLYGSNSGSPALNVPRGTTSLATDLVSGSRNV